MQAGRLRDKITIQTPMLAQSTTGEPQTVWEDYCDAWAAIESLSAREFLSAQQSQAETTTKITIRYVPGLTANMRAVLRDRTFEIIAPPMLLPQADRMLQLMCRELF